LWGKIKTGKSRKRTGLATSGKENHPSKGNGEKQQFSHAIAACPTERMRGEVIGFYQVKVKGGEKKIEAPIISDQVKKK